jgi:HAD superfamily hydrolase (TIGR01549 family)
MDGTITVPVLDFKKIRAETGILTGDLVETISAMSPADAARAWAVIERHEEEGRRRIKLQPGARRVLKKLSAAGLRLGLLTRNTRKSADHLLSLLDNKFDCVLTREFHIVKPDPGTVRHILEQWSLPPREALVIGDHLDDLRCAKAAGARSCFFRNPGAASYAEHADHTVDSFDGLAELVLP